MNSHLSTGSANIPSHLTQFVVDQKYDNYSPIDQAIWRYVMRQNSSFLGDKAHSAYLDGLRESGISVESIPNIEYMNKCLSRIGWGAITVDGFIPPSAFMDFQAHRILAIASDIRAYDHIAYTPAPDIIHEAAGHAPIILDETYRAYLQLIGEIGAKAFSSKEDHDVYEAIRLLSIVKEDRSSTSEQISAAEINLERAIQAVTRTSEASLVSRVYWWTVEYGLIGEIDNPLIYGAGLLSSVGESVSCLQEDVRKIPFSLDVCIKTDYDITKPQPQLFVSRNFYELMDAARELGSRLAFSIGGTYSLQKALESANTATVLLNSGLQVSGTVTEIEMDEQQEAVYFKTTGPSALAFDDTELPGHGKGYHHEGFGSPIGLLKGIQVPLENFNDQQLEEAGFVQGQNVLLTFESGVLVRGVVQTTVRKAGRVILITFVDCTVTYRGKTLFQSEWGPYDMAVGHKILSAYPGAADKEKFEASTHIASTLIPAHSEPAAEEQQQNALYQTVRNLRGSESAIGDEDFAAILLAVHSQLQNHFAWDWLLRLELLELLCNRSILPEQQETLHRELKQLAEESQELRQLIENGLKLLHS